MALELVDCIDIISIYHTRSSETPKELSEKIDWEAFLGKFSKETEAKGYCWVQEPTRVTSNVNPKHSTKTQAIQMLDAEGY